MSARDRRDENALRISVLAGETTMAKWIEMTIAPTVSDRFRSLAGRPLGMACSVILPESARLRLSALGSSFVTALEEQRHPMTGLLIASRGSAGGRPFRSSKASCGWHRATTKR